MGHGQVVDDQVAEHLESRGRCPGSCNTAARAREAEFARDAEASFNRRVAARREVLGRPLTEVELERVLYDAKVGVGELWRRADRHLLPFRPGRPSWCHRCAADVREALEGLPRLLLWTLETGIVPARRPDRSLMSAPVRVVDVGPGGDPWRVTEVLACGHRHTRGAGPAHPGQVRVCLTCVSSAIVPEPGRLAPPDRVAFQGRRRRGASPAGSPAWLEVDAVVRWVCGLADEIAGLVHGPEFSSRCSKGDLTERVRAATEACRYVAARLDVVQRMPEDKVEQVRKTVLDTRSRLQSVSGMKMGVRALQDPCPACGRRGLRQADGGGTVSCRACHAVWDEDELARRAALAASTGEGASA